MLKNHLTSIIQNYLGFTPTEGQSNIIDAFSEFILNQNERELLLIKGYAGTGKTSLIGAFVKTLKDIEINSVLLAPTGRAAKIFSTFAGTTATTIHKKIYRQKSSKDAFGDFSLNINLSSNTFFIVDEASMISDQNFESSIFGSGNLLSDLIEFVYSGKNCKLIVVGDTCQLPPVGLPYSKAMNKHTLQMFDLKVIETELNEVMRQANESGILLNATAIRALMDTPDFDKPRFSIGGFTDIKRIGGSELLDTISSAYDKYGMEDTVIICRSNKIANKYNQAIRNKILFRDEELASGDFLMVVKNNYFWAESNEKVDFIANGDIVKVKRVKKYQELYGFRFADVDVVFPDFDDLELSVKVILDTLYSEAPALTSDDNKRLFYTVSEDFMDIASLKKRYGKVKENPNYNALQVKFAYAITCHKSQGGQWPCVFIDQSFFRDEMLTNEYLKWLYTAITRSTKKVYLVNFTDSFFS